MNVRHLFSIVLGSELSKQRLVSRNVMCPIHVLAGDARRSTFLEYSKMPLMPSNEETRAA
jgi:hypothetical protein